jgi:Uma2 family endonuclease
MEKISQLSQLDLTKVYSYADYLQWRLEETVELIRGIIFPMAAPGTKHQQISFRLGGIFYNLFKNQPCQVFVAPYEVRLLDASKQLNQSKNIYTVIQPDLCIVCDISKIEERGCIGSPDLVVEILSPGNSKKEMNDKKKLYEENEIPEYWIFMPEHETMIRFDLDKTRGVYGRPEIFSSHQILESILFPNLKIDLKEVFNK